MDIFFNRTIRKGNVEYKVEIRFDDNSIMDNSAKFEIEAEKRAIPQGDSEKVTLEIDVQLEENQIVISNKETQIVLVTLPLDTYLEDSENLEGDNIDIDSDDTQIFSSLLNEGGGPLNAGVAEKIISSIPTDPFLGCLLKGAISTAVGQIIRCWSYIETNMESSFRQKAHEVYGCLREYAPRMLLTFMYRSGKCVATLGLA